MRVGITTHFQFSIFSGGGASTCLSMAETLKLLGHDVWLINTNGSQEWWDDLQSMKSMFPRVNLADVKEPFDLVLEVAQNLPDKETRARVGRICIWVIRKGIILHDIENSIFPVSLGRRNLEGLDGIWCLDKETTEDDKQYVETLARKPVWTVPFVWSPSMLEFYRKETGMPQWIQVAVQMTQQAQKQIPWSVHICETNNSATSSCTIPLVGLRQTKLHGQFLFEKYKIHNAQTVENAPFFKQNVLAHCQVEGLSGEFLGRQRIIDWSIDPMSCIVGHLRFRNIRPYFLDALWCGIPLVHNSPLLKGLVQEYSGYFYEDNSILGIQKGLQQIQNDISQGKGMFHQDAFQRMKMAILEEFSPLSSKIQKGYEVALQSLPPPCTLCKQGPAAPVFVPVAPAPVAVAAAIPVAPSNECSVLFTDMWDEFNPEYNMFLLMMIEGSKNLVPKPEIKGYSLETLPHGKRPNVILFGPFGTEWQNEKWKDVPKAHFTGENTQPIQREGVFLNMAYPHADFADEHYVRLPLWMLEIDWFGANVEKIRNPKPLPIDRCTKVYPEEISEKKRFCAFVVTNPCNPVRNSAFHWLSQYKNVDSAGRLFNNIGDEIFAGLGGGGGELKKHEFLKKYKFCLAYENSSAQGYTTEKLLHAKVAGCIPIYWGDPKVERDFDTKGFLDARNIQTPEALIEAVRAIDENPRQYLKMFSVPALDDFRRDMVRRSLSHVAYMLLKYALPSMNIKVEMIPRFLGATSTQEAKEMQKLREGAQTIEVPVSATGPGATPIIIKRVPRDPSRKLPDNMLIVSFATARFLPSLHQLLAALDIQRKVLPGLEVWVWLGEDVNPSADKSLKETFDFVRFKRFDYTQVGFPDYWEPQHFAWKLHLLKEVNREENIHGRLVFYMDSGVFLSRWPKAWLQIAEEEGICVLEDPRQTNDRWCHETFCRKLGVSDFEKSSQQIWAGSLAFVAGHPKASKLILNAYEWSKERDVIVGPKWEGVRNGLPYGHRHDQSILSILSQRQGVVRYPMDEIYCDHSLRKTFLTGKCLYVHRGGFTVHKPFAQDIDDCFVINLDKRKDRMEKLFTHNPELKDRVQRLSAVHGLSLKLTPAIARLFKPHDFFWKKAVMGCALSHLTLWWQLANERPEIQNYLILEDDAKLQKGWEDRWNAATPFIPEDYDVVYLGGILPPNRRGFELVKERVNDHISKVAPNNFFGQREPTSYFHWCAYAYVLSRQGAMKILELMNEHDGYWTSADHMICNRVDKMNIYFLDPLVAGCYQDDDPKYQASQFNDFSRIDGFDSDLWNNDERFSNEEAQGCLREAQEKGFGIDIAKALQDVRSSVEVPNVVPESPETVVGKDSAKAEAMEGIQHFLQREALDYIRQWKSEDWSALEKKDQLRSYMRFLERSSLPAQDPTQAEVRATHDSWKKMQPQGEDALTLWTEVEKKLETWSKCSELYEGIPKASARRFLTLQEHNFQGETAYEKEWLQELLGKQIPFRVERISSADPPPSDKPIVIVQRPWIDSYQRLFEKWEAAGCSYSVLHVSDEYGTDRIDFYNFTQCLGVVRMYARPDTASMKKVFTIPLGYHWTMAAGSEDPVSKTPRLPFRNVVWSFYGTRWMNREELLAPLKEIEPHNLLLVDSWESKEKLSRNQYIASLLDTIFVPCPGGNNIETFRLYEALECGCIPIYVKIPGDDMYIEMLQNELGLLAVSSWQEAKILMAHFIKEKEIMENYRNSLLIRWRTWKARLGEKVRSIWSLS